jgi:glycosyltransferase involved in cell wall biosynthesis
VRVVYVDTGMVGEVGHHATSCRLITRALRDRGHDVTVAAWAGLEEPLRVEFAASTVFRHNTYWGSDGDPLCGWLAAYFVTSHATTQDLVALGPFTPADLLYVNSVLPAQLNAVYHFLAALPDGARPQTVVELGTDPGVELVAGGGGVSLAARDPRIDARATLYRFTARQMSARRLSELHLITFDRTSSEVYSMLLGMPVGTLPLPHVAGGVPRRRGGDSPRTVAFLGHQRGEKGYHFVPAIASQLLATRDDVRLLVHNAQPDGMSEVQQAMRALAAADGRIELDERPAGPESWYSLLERSDIIVCPYLVDRFRAAYSALASVAIASAIPLVAPEHTTLARLVQDFAAGGACFARQEPEAVVAAIGRVLADFDTQAERAAAAAVRWAETMGADRMVEAMLARVAAAAMEQRAPFRLAA